MYTEIEEPHEEVLARLPGNLGRDRDLDHILRESFDCGFASAVEECADDPNEPGKAIDTRGGPEVVPA